MDRPLSYPHRAKKPIIGGYSTMYGDGGDNHVDVRSEKNDDNLLVITGRSHSFGMSSLSYCVVDLYFSLDRLALQSFPAPICLLGQMTQVMMAK
jgi:hypothetical protein